MEGFTTEQLFDCLKNVQEFQELVKIETHIKEVDSFYLFSGNQRLKAIFKKNNVFHEISLLIKFAPTNIIIRERLDIENKFVKECFFYFNLLPKLANKIGMPELTDLFPKCYYSFGKAPKEFLVLRDVSPEGFHSIETPLKVDLGSLHLALTALAKLHAAGIVFKWNHKEEFNYVSNRFTVVQNLHCYFQDIFVDQMKDRGIKAARRDGIDISEDFENKLYSIVVKFYKCVKKTSPWYTIAHGDALITNFLFNDTQAKLIDLQLLCCASVCYDLVCLVYVSTEKDFRDKYLDALLLQYYHELTCTISRLTNLSKDNLEKRGLDFKSLKRNFQLHLPLAYRICSYFVGPLLDYREFDKLADILSSDKVSFDRFVLEKKKSNLGGEKVDRRLIDIIREIMEANIVDEMYAIF